MNIDLSPLYSNTIDEITLDGKYQIDKSYFENSDVIDLPVVDVKGYIKKYLDDDLYIMLDVTGEMILADSITLDEVNYPFSFKIEGNMAEILGNSPNSLDIFELLWENIVLEVPLKFTKETDLSKFHGDGWRLVSQDDETLNNNPFKELLKDTGKE